MQISNNVFTVTYFNIHRKTITLDTHIQVSPLIVSNMDSYICFYICLKLNEDNIFFSINNIFQ